LSLSREKQTLYTLGVVFAPSARVKHILAQQKRKNGTRPPKESRTSDTSAETSALSFGLSLPAPDQPVHLSISVPRSMGHPRVRPATFGEPQWSSCRPAVW